MAQTVKANSLGSFVRSISGIFMNKSNPNGITNKECTLIAQLIFILSEKSTTVVDRQVKIELANMTNHNLQVITNYIGKFKNKGIILEDNKIHPLFLETEITIKHLS